MRTVTYDGSFEGLLCAVFDVYEYKMHDAEICLAQEANGNIFGEMHAARMNTEHSARVWKGLEKKLSHDGLQEVYRAFLSGLPGMENILLRYIQYVFSSKVSVEQDFSNPHVLQVHQAAKKVWREKHRMEAFVRFSKTADGLFYSVIEPEHDVLPLISRHFEERYADQHWLIYDARRRYGIHYNLEQVSEVSLSFSDSVTGSGISSIYDENEDIYQQLWQQYFKSVNIPARKNTRLHLQHMPRRYWKYLVEKKA
ncbi:MAG TPA: TIGR03915 family putative DNA repair protein [Flavisolibacter sp.]|jgi:probable DNA metabolism protein